ncbi:hypothetical protein BDB01DRAFT_770037 [Pilobolus umbonatus]|nr:hypothetical protein BDB01DRAFT_770037 [Pilobolus umbonatus]
MFRILHVLLLLTALIHTINAFCIYNHMDSVGVYIMNAQRKDIPNGRIFAKGLSANAIECCHYSNIDCSTDKTRFYRNVFEYHFYYLKEDGTMFNSKKTFSTCYAGGALVFTGNSQQYKAECIHPDGTRYGAPFVSMTE